ncbi:unnamed protein product [Allacma fusca]|uniref:Uncharacterized protein n=1 Tax=Allacma fusca TaxID=39272 RepID=A0A8J2LPJ2_9HEXA|nr:unnamed protein product [Allacma fusca]
MNSEIVNTQIVISDLLCNPGRALYFRNLWENSLKEGLWECLFGETNLELSDQCETELDGEGIRRRYQDLGTVLL